MRILIINGPKLNLLGKREPAIYGHESFESYLDKLREEFPGVVMELFQSDDEGEIIGKLHEADKACDGIILNAGRYTHTSAAIGNAVKSMTTPLIEVHISKIFAREDFRQISFIAPHATGSISGFGLASYRLAILHFLK